MSLKYFIKTHGCQMNYSDSERMQTVLEKMGFESADEMESADFIVFNTCSIKQKAEDKVYGQMTNIKKLKKKNPNLRVGITGCMVKKTSGRRELEEDENPKKVFDRLIRILPEIDIALRIEELPKLPELLREQYENEEFEKLEEEYLYDYFHINPTYTNDFQAFVSIGTGCDNFCTYCIVPYSRKREKSRTIEDIYVECKKLVEDGCKEITLLGQNVNSYGISNEDRKTNHFKGIDHPFVELMGRVDSLKKKGLKRLRFTSNHPKDLTDEVINAFKELETLMPYLHLPVQAGNDEMLKRMNRNYTAESYKKIVSKLRKAVPGISISTDIIVGFCQETEEQFIDTCKLYEEVRWDMCYLAKYSQRKGTFAAGNLEDNISTKEKKKRYHRLNVILKQCALESHQRFEGKEVEVLVEKWKDGKCEGRSEHYKTTFFPSMKDLTGELVKVKVLKGREWLLEGEIV